MGVTQHGITTWFHPADEAPEGGIRPCFPGACLAQSFLCCALPASWPLRGRSVHIRALPACPAFCRCWPRMWIYSQNLCSVLEKENKQILVVWQQLWEANKGRTCHQALDLPRRHQKSWFQASAGFSPAVPPWSGHLLPPGLSFPLYEKRLLLPFCSDVYDPVVFTTSVFISVVHGPVGGPSLQLPRATPTPLPQSSRSILPQRQSQNCHMTLISPPNWLLKKAAGTNLLRSETAQLRFFLSLDQVPSTVMGQTMSPLL
jgi:hypothetical protein